MKAIGTYILLYELNFKVNTRWVGNLIKTFTRLFNSIFTYNPFRFPALIVSKYSRTDEVKKSVRVYYTRDTVFVIVVMYMSRSTDKKKKNAAECQCFEKLGFSITHHYVAYALSLKRYYKFVLHKNEKTKAEHVRYNVILYIGFVCFTRSPRFSIEHGSKISYSYVVHTRKLV